MNHISVYVEKIRSRMMVGEWHQISKYCIRSQNGYQVARIHGKGRVTWEAWGPGVDPAHFKPGKQVKEFLGIFTSGQEARDTCETHSQTTSGGKSSTR